MYSAIGVHIALLSFCVNDWLESALIKGPSISLTLENIESGLRRMDSVLNMHCILYL